MKNTKDFHKIANGSYGVINFNRMIPVPKECIIHFDFANEPNALYRALLQKQYRYISDIEDVIIKKSNTTNSGCSATCKSCKCRPNYGKSKRRLRCERSRRFVLSALWRMFYNVSASLCSSSPCAFTA